MYGSYDSEQDWKDTEYRPEDEAGFGEAYSGYKGFGFESNESRAARLTMEECRMLGYPVHLAKDYVKPEPKIEQLNTAELDAKLEEMRQLHADMAVMVEQLSHRAEKELKEVKKQRKRNKMSEEELEYCLNQRITGVKYAELAADLSARFGKSWSAGAIRLSVSKYLRG